MSTIAEFMRADHHFCDEAFALAEQAALDNNWEEAEIRFNHFREDMARHFRMEESELFPTLIAGNGPAGPVQVMRMEHAQMNALIEQMSGAVKHRDAQEYGGVAETLLIVMQQHNLKEEQMLYPMADHFLTAQRETLLGRMRQV
ncbi:MAG: hemerythrin domain-containing protein [Sideroxyarcus sp.]|nr:hemerythrin domain-containing protein [Sideroxyarcus sp.]